VLGGGAGVLLGSLFYASFSMGFLPGDQGVRGATLGGSAAIGGAMAGGILFGLIETSRPSPFPRPDKDGRRNDPVILILLPGPRAWWV